MKILNLLQFVRFQKRKAIFVTASHCMQQTNLHTTIGNNIRLLRDKLGLTQQALADYLNIAREQISFYETGTRSIPTGHISALADLFCIDESDFYEEDPTACGINLAFAFRADSIEVNDLKKIAAFKKIVRNYVNMQNVPIDECE